MTMPCTSLSMFIPPEKKCTANTSAFQDEGKRLKEFATDLIFASSITRRRNEEKAIFKYVLEKEKRENEENKK